jgi:hypothetical protein
MKSLPIVVRKTTFPIALSVRKTAGITLGDGVAILHIRILLGAQKPNGCCVSKRYVIDVILIPRADFSSIGAFSSCITLVKAP